MMLSPTSSLSAGTYALSVENVLAVTENAMERSLAGVTAGFEVTEEQVTHVAVPLLQGGCWPADIYDVHGRLVRKGATSFDGLSKGIYIVNNQKYIH